VSFWVVIFRVIYVPLLFVSESFVKQGGDAVYFQVTISRVVWSRSGVFWVDISGSFMFRSSLDQQVLSSRAGMLYFLQKSAQSRSGVFEWEFSGSLMFRCF
jgi:hypothetical protein